MNRQNNEDRVRIPELDGLRGIAALMVLGWHYIGAILDPALGAWSRWASEVLILGRTGVDLFFVLSGFLITGIVLGRSRSNGPFLGVFYLRRALRILPPYLLLVVVFWAVVWAGISNPAFNDETPLWRHLTFTQNFWMADQEAWGPGAISITWSVAIEEQFYLVFPLLMLLLPRRLVPAVLISVAVGSVMYRLAVYTGPATAFYAYVSTLARLDGLAVGGLLAWAWQQPDRRVQLQTNRRIVYAFTGAGLAILPVLAVLIQSDMGWHMFHWGHTYLALWFGCVLMSVLLARGTARTALLRVPAARFAGRISYSLYLFHPLVLSAVFIVAGRSERVRGVADAACVLCALGLTVTFCWLLSRFLETPAIRWGRRFSY